MKPLVTIAIAALGLVGPARAVGNINGTYEGKLRCRATSPAAASKTRQDLTVEVLADAGRFDVDILVQAQPYAMNAQGSVVEPPGKDDRATLAGVDCDLGVSTGVGTALYAEVVVKPGSEKGTIKGTFLRISGSDGTTSELCTFSAKRTATAIPSISACAP